MNGAQQGGRTLTLLTNDSYKAVMIPEPAAAAPDSYNKLTTYSLNPLLRKFRSSGFLLIRKGDLKATTGQNKDSGNDQGNFIVNVLYCRPRTFQAGAAGRGHLGEHPPL